MPAYDPKQDSARPAPSQSVQALPQSPPTQPQSPPTQPTAPALAPYNDPLEQPIVIHAPGSTTAVTPGTMSPGSPAAPVYVEPMAPMSVASLPSEPAYNFEPEVVRPDHLGSTYIPVDSIVYPMAMRLYSLGYLDTVYLAMRPWTRRSLLHALEATKTNVMDSGNEEAEELLAALMYEVREEAPGAKLARGRVYGLESIYTRVMGISGLTLRDSYHLGQTIDNDYGRPYSNGFNNVTGFSTVNELGPFSLYVRGEYQHAPAYVGYTATLANYLSTVDQIPFAPPHIPQATIPYLNTQSQDNFALQEATLSVHLLGHEISGGKSDAWIGPGMGGGMAWSNNAQDIYSFRINRVEPLHIPYFSRIFGPVRYDFFVGSLKGHNYPNEPWVHAETISLAPSSNFQFSFERTVIWGGHGHGCVDYEGGPVYPCDEPITLHTFLKSFFNVTDTTGTEKYSRDDPGARYSVFSFSYRLPFFRHTLTLYTDSIAHDDVTPISAPRRAAYRPGLYLSHFPGLPKLDLRVEAASTDTSTLRSLGGQFNYYETIQRQGYTNKGIIMGDEIGREAKGGNAWLTYHLSPLEFVQLSYLNKKTPKDFIQNGTTQNQLKLDVVKRFHKDIEVNAWYQYEHWIAPVFRVDHITDNTFAGSVTWYPKLHTAPVPAQ
jgi:hypothetical protein